MTGPVHSERGWTFRFIAALTFLAVAIGCCGGVTGRVDWLPAVGLVVAGIGAGTALMVITTRLLRREIGPVTAAVGRYCDAVVAGDVAAAYDMFSPHIRRTLTAKEYAQTQGLVPRMVEYRILGVHMLSRAGTPNAEVSLYLSFVDGREAQGKLRLVKQSDGQWMVASGPGD